MDGSVFKHRWQKEIVFSTHPFRQTLRSTPQWSYFPGVKWPGLGVKHTAPSAEIKNASTLLCACMAY